jgi:hypothetical protein
MFIETRGEVRVPSVRRTMFIETRGEIGVPSARRAMFPRESV